MPGMNGIELSRRIKDSGGDEAVVVMISSADWSVIEEDAKNAGVNKFLAKPFFPSSITDSINECLGVKKLGAGEDVQSGGDMDCFQGFTILLAEDVGINQEIIITLLEPTGVKIDCADNGAEALALFSANPDKYDLIFMDVQMPEMDGFEATRRIRAFEAEWLPQGSGEAGGRKKEGIPIIAMTANVFREDIEKCLAAGMNSHVGKPIDIDDVLVKLRQYLPLNEAQK
jgi:CheY-like chemotaxis protein